MNEWLAVNSLLSFQFIFFLAVDVFNVANLLYSSLSEYCTSTACPTMNAGAEYEYLWSDPDGYFVHLLC